MLLLIIINRVSDCRLPTARAPIGQVVNKRNGGVVSETKLGTTKVQADRCTTDTVGRVGEPGAGVAIVNYDTRRERSHP